MILFGQTSLFETTSPTEINEYLENIAFRNLMAESPNQAIQEAFAKTFTKIRRLGGIDPIYQNVVVSVSGGADSDIVVDIIERCGYEEGRVNVE